MADYSTNLRTQYLNARTHQANRQTEFRLDKNTLYQSNLRLINMGLNGGTHTGAYNPRGGVLALIKNIRLMDGSRELSSLRHAANFLAFKNINAPMETVQNIHDMLHKSNVASVLIDTGEVQDNQESPTNYVANANFSNKDLGYVDLRLCLPLLQEMGALDTSIFKNLRLVVEYNNSTLSTTSKAHQADINEPILVADEVVGEQKKASMKKLAKSSVMWMEVEHDLFNVPDAPVQPAVPSETLPQNVNRTINGFDNKYVSRVLICKTPNDKTENYDGNITAGDGNIVSLAMLNEELQVRHKGSNLFNSDGLSNTAFKQMLLQETWGQISVKPFSAQTMVGLDTLAAYKNVNGTYRKGGNGMEQTIGQYDYIGFQVEDYVKQLQFNYKRDIVKEVNPRNRMNFSIDVEIYGEVRKQLTFNGDSYQISYV